MKKILILSIFFPPCNLTASQRAFSWACNLKKFGFWPIIITRRWDHPIKELKDISIPTENEIIHELNEDYEVYYMPYTGNFRDRLYNRYGENKFTLLRKFFTFFELVFQNLILAATPFSILYIQAEKLLKSNDDIKVVLATGNPFVVFNFAYRLKKKYNINWIADYRDAWTTETYTNLNFFKKLIKKIDSFFERKWVSTCSIITATSEPLSRKISKLVNVQYEVLYNGFNENEFEKVEVEAKDFFQITYVGTLYEKQKIEIFSEAYKHFIDSKNKDLKIKLLFPGLSFYKDQSDRIFSIFKGYESYIEVMPRIEREKVLKIEKNSHLLLHVAWDEVEGVIASKIYEYLASGSSILVVPSDKGEIEKILEKTKAGECLNNKEEIVVFLEKSYNEFLNGNTKRNNIYSEEILFYSRTKQVNKLAEILKTI